MRSNMKSVCVLLLLAVGHSEFAHVRVGHSALHTDDVVWSSSAAAGSWILVSDKKQQEEETHEVQHEECVCAAAAGCWTQSSSCLCESKLVLCPVCVYKAHVRVGHSALHTDDVVWSSSAAAGSWIL
ncbi:hypothetical protein WMY93_034071 [Mugilogobius chulae]|uniref:Uncharacterized protein n=1 Tax=Mugilogobius chulae TaxID=88201 RepID=A0AAW0MJ36_9GOBI